MTRWLLGFGVLVGIAGTLSAAEPATEKLDFGRDVRAILSNNCFKCHGPDEKQRQAGLRLDQRDGATAKLESGKVGIAAGKWSDSEIIARLTTDNADLKMPPPASGKKVSAGQIENLKRWINEGAEYKPHWSFVAAARPEFPKVSEDAWIKNPIDRFVLAQLDKAGLKPSPQADKVTLIRRLTFDLTGLPPTPAEVDAFVADNSAEAYDKLVERLLNSARHGEHQARYWLDAARYGDTHGLHLDNERSLWPYRDWVIGAFNRNVPFNQFTVEQLAGDLLPNATQEQRIASGFNRCNVTTSEGGSINEEVQVRYAVDRTEAIGTVWLGLTVGCAVCHDHKFDPISQKEFYQLYAFYGSTADAAMDGNALLPPPVIKLPSAEHAAQFKAIDDELGNVRKQISDEVAKIEYTEPASVEGKPAGEPKDFVWIDDAAPSGAKLEGNSPWEFVSKPAPVFSGEKATKRSGEGNTQHFFTGATAPLKIGEGDKLFAYCYLDPANPPKTVMLQWNDGIWEHRAFWGEDKIAFGTGDVPGHRRLGDLPKLGEWVRLEVDAAHVGLPAGKLVNGWAFTQFDGTMFWDKAGIVTRTPQDGGGFESLLAWESYDKAQAQSTVPQPIRDAIKLESDKRNDDQKKQIREYFLTNVYAKSQPVLAPLNAKIAALNKQRTDLDGAIPSTMVMADMPQLRDTNILIRGAYNKKGDKVTHGVPAALGGKLPDGAPINRLSLAKWLVDPSHPLSSRVTVNRFWQQFFGRGIVKTSEDFGIQGDWPTHPELLDWLATEFQTPTARTLIENTEAAAPKNWDMRHLMRLIVTSNTYRQSSRVSPDLVKRDPENMLLARGPRFRFDAEVIRDAALFTSGLLVEKVGGKSVKPYQPLGLWEAVAFVGSTTSQFKRDAGEALYRRSMYTFWKRTSPPPQMTTFDAPSREVCSVRRPRTNTPLQALATMNDEQFVEASRHFARRMLLEGGTTYPDRVIHGFRLATGRKPSPAELEVLVALFQEHHTHYQSKADEAVKLLSIGESKRDEALNPSEYAAMTMLANLLLNLDETLTKE
ncbi:peptidyl-prolyl cis-trans isomerase [Planctomycetia bacterium]|nr:peptidyl-prolyl cis-trans isomerase [Planctomycetia bacterium]